MTALSVALSLCHDREATSEEDLIKVARMVEHYIQTGDLGWVPDENDT